MCDCAMCERTNGRACERDADDTVRDAEARVYDATVARLPQADAAADERLYAETALYYARMGDDADDAPADDDADECYCGAPLHGYAGPCGDCRARRDDDAAYEAAQMERAAFR